MFHMQNELIEAIQDNRRLEVQATRQSTLLSSPDASPRRQVMVLSTVTNAMGRLRTTMSHNPA